MNKAEIDIRQHNLTQMYIEMKMSLPEISGKTKLSKSTIRRRLMSLGVRMRTKAEALALVPYKIGKGNRGKSRPCSEETKKKISIATMGKGKGVSVKTDGSIQFTMGPNKHRGEHVVIMERIIGRRIRKGECVHHIDRDKSNNDPSNLAFLSTSAHARLHRFEEKIEGNMRERNDKGQFI